jgi:hypothetical protein
MNDLEELINFSACGNAINGTVPDFSNTKMEFLRLYTNKLTDAGTKLAGMTNLTFISLGDNAITGDVPDISALTKLTDVYMDCNHFSGAVPSSYGGLHLKGKCFLDASTLLEKCSTDYDNTFACPLPSGAAKECHATCK